MLEYKKFLELYEDYLLSTGLYSKYEACVTAYKVAIDFDEYLVGDRPDYEEIGQ